MLLDSLRCAPAPVTFNVRAMSYFRHIDWKTLFIAFFAFYILPAICAIAVAGWLIAFSESGGNQSILHTTLIFSLLWWWLVAPIGSGYLAARLAKQLPLLHAMLTVTFGYLFQIAKVTQAVWWLLPSWAVISLAGGLFGAYVWRIQKTRQL